MSRLGTFLVQEGILTASDRQVIKRESSALHGSFARSVLALGLLDEDELSALIASKTSFPLVAKDIFYEMDPDIANLVPLHILAWLEVLPLSKSEGSLRVAMVDPTDQDAISQLGFFTGLRIRPVIAKMSEISRGLRKIGAPMNMGDSSFEGLLRTLGRPPQLQESPRSGAASRPMEVKAPVPQSKKPVVKNISIPKQPAVIAGSDLNDAALASTAPDELLDEGSTGLEVELPAELVADQDADAAEDNNVEITGTQADDASQEGSADTSAEAEETGVESIPTDESESELVASEAVESEPSVVNVVPDEAISETSDSAAPEILADSAQDEVAEDIQASEAEVRAEEIAEVAAENFAAAGIETVSDTGVADESVATEITAAEVIASEDVHSDPSTIDAVTDENTVDEVIAENRAAAESIAELELETLDAIVEDSMQTDESLKAADVEDQSSGNDGPLTLEVEAVSSDEIGDVGLDDLVQETTNDEVQVENSLVEMSSVPDDLVEIQDEPLQQASAADTKFLGMKESDSQSSPEIESDIRTDVNEPRLDFGVETDDDSRFDSPSIDVSAKDSNRPHDAKDLKNEGNDIDASSHAGIAQLNRALIGLQLMNDNARVLERVAEVAAKVGIGGGAIVLIRNGKIVPGILWRKDGAKFGSIADSPIGMEIGAVRDFAARQSTNEAWDLIDDALGESAEWIKNSWPDPDHIPTMAISHRHGETIVLGLAYFSGESEHDGLKESFADLIRAVSPRL